MMRLMFMLLVILIAAIVGTLLYQDPGYVLITAGKWSLETTLATAAILLVATMSLLWLIISCLHYLCSLPAAIHSWLMRRRAEKAAIATQKGLIEFTEGDWHAAKQHLTRALPDIGAPLVNYLMAARAAQEMGNIELRDNYLGEAQKLMPEASTAIELTQAELQLSNKQWEQARATLKHLYLINPQHPQVLKMLLQLYQTTGDQEQIIQLLPDLKRRKLLPPEELAALQAEYLIQQKEFVAAEALLKKSLNKYFTSKLATLYGILPEAASLEFLEKLPQKHPDSAELYLAIGKISMHNKLWGKAKTALETSLKLAPTTDTYLTYGKLLEIMHDDKGAAVAWRNAAMQKK